MSWYLTIRADPEYSRFEASTRLLEFFCALPELRQTAPVAFESVPGVPWVVVFLAAYDSHGSYTTDGSLIPQVNVVELICSSSGDPAWFETLAGRIAALLSWAAFEDHEDRHVWPHDRPSPGVAAAQDV